MQLSSLLITALAVCTGLASAGIAPKSDHVRQTVPSRPNPHKEILTNTHTISTSPAAQMACLKETSVLSSNALNVLTAMLMDATPDAMEKCATLTLAPFPAVDVRLNRAEEEKSSMQTARDFWEGGSERLG